MLGRYLPFHTQADVDPMEVVKHSESGDIDAVARSLKLHPANLRFIYGEIPIAVTKELYDILLTFYGRSGSDLDMVESWRTRMDEDDFQHVPVFFDGVKRNLLQGHHRFIAYWQAGYVLLPVFLVVRR